MPTEKLAYALSYTRFGMLVFPCHHIERDGECSCGRLKCPSAGKHPRDKGWQASASLDEQVIQQFWRAEPLANIGVACGEASNITVLDVDGDLGFQTLTDLQIKNGEFPDTPIALTGSGGAHYYFQYEPSVQNAVRFAAGLDIRTQGGLVIGVGSRTKRKYEWEVVAPLSYDLMPAKMPAWLVGLIVAKPNGNGRPKVPEEPLHEGEGRNNLLFKLARSLHAQAFPPAAIEAALRVLNDTFKPPLDKREVDQVIRNAIQAPDRPDFNPVLSVDGVKTAVPPSTVEGGAGQAQNSLQFGDIVCEDFEASEKANTEYLKRHPIIDRLGYSESIALIVGGKHAGKTTNVRTVALSVARGLPVWGRATHQGHVIYAASDDELAITRNELMKMGRTASDPLTLLSAAPGKYPDPERIVSQIRTFAEKNYTVLIILDMLFDFAKIKDEMSYSGTREALGKLQTLASETKALVLASHHSPKYMLDTATASTAALGSQGVAARFSPIILTKKWADDLYTIESTMTRDPRGQALPVSVIQVNADGWVENTGEFKSWMKWKVYAPRVMALFEQAEPGQKLSVSSVVEDLQISRPEAQNTLFRLWQDGHLMRERNKRSMLYWIEKNIPLWEKPNEIKGNSSGTF